MNEALDDRFAWTKFYSEFADRLLKCRKNRKPLVKQIYEINESLFPNRNTLIDRFEDKTHGPIEDIDPFTTMSMFNKGLKPANRSKIAGTLAQYLGIKIPAPSSFPGIPVMHNMNWWFFPYAYMRGDDHIDLLWSVFSDALKYAGNDSKSNRTRFVKSFNNVIELRDVNRRLTTGLYWIRPYVFPSLDIKTRHFLEEQLGMDVPKEIDAESYLELKKRIKSKFGARDASVSSFPELALAAWHYDLGNKVDGSHGGGISDPVGSYDIKNIVSEGCFLEESELREALAILKKKKNMVLQGPPGTGKTWLAKRLAYALIGSKDDDHIIHTQFHSNWSYEDFVRGYRPDKEAKLELVDGPLLKAAEQAGKNPDAPHVCIIEEINRGNPANIFGEMLTLLESDKREDMELRLTYPGFPEERVSLPENLYVIGTMNLADRSLAMVDSAFRRRFAFVDLKPSFNDRWRNWCKEHVDGGFLEKLKKKMEGLNETIATDDTLGSQFCIGHSFVTPNEKVDDHTQWFKRIVATEIRPLLDEYWFDNPETSEKETEKLLNDL